MKLPWIVSPTSVGSGISMPIPKPPMARPRMMLWEAERTNPVDPPVWLPSMITRTWAVLPLIAGTVFGTDVIRVGSSEGAHGGCHDENARRGTAGEQR